MTCQEFVELVTAYLEGALSEKQRDAFEEHMAVCPGCDVYLDQFRQTIELLGELPKESLSAAARHNLLDAFAGWHSGPDGPAT